MKLINVVLGAFLVISLSHIAQAEESSKTKETKKECPLKTITVAHINYKNILQQDDDIGKLYESYTNKVMALPTTGHFTNFKITNQNIRTDSPYGSENRQVYIDISIEFDLNYQAITDLSALKVASLNVNTFETKRCRCCR